MAFIPSFPTPKPMNMSSPAYEFGIRGKTRNTQIDKNFIFYIHVGVYGFLSQSISHFSSLKPSKLEKIEMLECIRFIENGQKIKMIRIDNPTIGIDTPNDLIEAKKYLDSI